MQLFVTICFLFMIPEQALPRAKSWDAVCISIYDSCGTPWPLKVSTSSKNKSAVGF